MILLFLPGYQLCLNPLNQVYVFNPIDSSKIYTVKDGVLIP